jgi:hypothetical protein
MMASRSEALGRLRSSTLEPDGWAANWSHALLCARACKSARVHSPRCTHHRFTRKQNFEIHYAKKSPGEIFAFPPCWVNSPASGSRGVGNQADSKVVAVVSPKTKQKGLQYYTTVTQAMGSIDLSQS